MKAALLLLLSNVFMTFAWYGHLKWFPKANEDGGYFPFKIILLSWGIAFFEYCFQVPGNRVGNKLEGLSLGQLKIMQEAITLGVFVLFAILFMKERLNWRFVVAGVLIFFAVAVVFTGRKQ